MQTSAPPTCPVLAIEPWYWHTLEAARRMRHPSWPVHDMPSDLVYLCEALEDAIEAADAAAERADQILAEHRERARALSRGQTA